jgi:glycogen(starch) synthase
MLAPSAFYPHVGGIEELTRQLALALQARDHEVAVLTNRWPEGVRRAEILDGIKVDRLRFPLPAKRPAAAVRFIITAPTAALTLLRQLRSWRPDVVHVIGAGPQSVYLGWLRSLVRAQLVFTYGGELSFDAHGAFQRSATLRLGLRRMLAEADSVTACSAYVLSELEAVRPAGSRARVIPNAVDPDELAAGPEEEGLGRYVLGVGRLVPQKGFDVLLDAFDAESLAGLNLAIAGEGFERQRLEHHAAKLALGTRFRLLGTVDRSRLGQLFRGARVFVLPSRGEPFGIALLEAMAAGVPAVATRAGGVPEFATDGENALLVPPEDPRALAEAIARAAHEEELRERLIAGGRRTAAELSWDRVVSVYEDLYRSLLATSR